MSIKPIGLPPIVTPLKEVADKTENSGAALPSGKLPGIGAVGGKAETFANTLRDTLKSGGPEALQSLSELTMGNQFLSSLTGGKAGQLAELNDLNMLMDSMAGQTSLGSGQLFSGMMGSAVTGGMQESDLSRVKEMLREGPAPAAQPTAPQSKPDFEASYVKTAGADATAGIQATQPPSPPEAPSPVQPSEKSITNPIGMHLARAAGYIASSGQADMAATAKNVLAQKAYGTNKTKDTLGQLSARFESSGNPGTIGYDKVGGTSYGIYQISSRAGTFDQFLSFCDKVAPDLAQRFRAAGPADTGSKHGPMPSVWRTVAQEQPERFSKLQHNFIEKSHFAPALRKISEMTGIDLSGRHQAIAQVLWSTAVQHGASGSASIFAQALQNAGAPGGADFEQNLIKEVYAKRSGQFGSSTERVQQAVSGRFKQEMQAALSLLGSDALLDSSA